MSVDSEPVNSIAQPGRHIDADDDMSLADRDIYPRSLFAERPVMALLFLSVLLSMAVGIFAGFLQLY